MLIGVFSIIVVMTAMRVLERNVESNLSQLGSQTFAIQKLPDVQFGNRPIGKNTGGAKTSPSNRDKRSRKKPRSPPPSASKATFWGGRFDPLRQDRAQRPVARRHARQFLGAQLGLDEGRLFDDSDVDNARSVCVLGSALAKTIFPFGSALGEQIKINGINYAVVGVLAPKGGSVGGNQDNFAVIPLTTALHRYGLRWSGLSIMVQARSAADYADCEEQVRGILRAVRKVRPGDPDDFELFSNDSLIEQFNSFTRAVRIGVTVVSSIALLAAGVGIMNIMLVSVTERTREIGVRRAVGAKGGTSWRNSSWKPLCCAKSAASSASCGHPWRQRPRVVYESPARHPGGLDCAGAGDLLHRGHRLRNLSRLQGREPRPD